MYEKGKGKRKCLIIDVVGLTGVGLARFYSVLL